MDWEVCKIEHDKLPLDYWVEGGEFCFETDWIDHHLKVASLLDDLAANFVEEMFPGYSKLCLAIASFHHEIDPESVQTEPLFKVMACSGSPHIWLVILDDPDDVDVLRGSGIDSLFESVVGGAPLPETEPQISFTTVRFEVISGYYTRFKNFMRDRWLSWSLAFMFGVSVALILKALFFKETE